MFSAAQIINSWSYSLFFNTQRKLCKLLLVCDSWYITYIMADLKVKFCRTLHNSQYSWDSKTLDRFDHENVTILFICTHTKSIFTMGDAYVVYV